MEDTREDSAEKTLKKIDYEEGKFTANEREYFIDKELSADRYYKMQELSYDLGFGVTYSDMFTNLNSLYELLNKSQFADAAIMVHNMLNGIADLENREMPVLKYCTCFINFKGEDKRYWSEEMAQEKIDDWLAEGIDFHSFFLLSINTVHGLRENYNSHILSISPNLKK